MPSDDSKDCSGTYRGVDEPYDEPLRFAVVELTNRCNLKCAHCASKSGHPRQSELAKDEWMPLFDELAELGCIEVTLLGGEIFLRDDWYDLVKAVAARDMEIAIVTNGLLINDEVMERLNSLPIMRLGVSLDGASPEAYRKVRGIDGFKKVWSLIERVRDSHRIPISAITTYSQLNLSDFENMAALMTGSGVTWQVQIAGRVSRRFSQELFITRRQYRQLCHRLGEMIIDGPEEPEIVMMDDMGYFPLEANHSPLYDWWKGCQAGTKIIGIRANGDVLGCLSLGDSFIEDNIRDRSLRDIWRSPTSFEQMRHKAEKLQGPCRSCPHAERCRAGCAAMAYSAMGTINDNPYCIRRMECEEMLGQLD